MRKRVCAVKLWRAAAAGGALCVNLATADAAVTPWVGTADYTVVPGGTGTADTVGPFSSYDFSNNGVLLLQPPAGQTFNGLTVGDVFQGRYESYVQAHDDGQGNTLPSPNLNAAGGYELTIAATFSELVTGVDANTGVAEFSIAGGNANLFFDSPPDRSFAGDSGFTDGTSILSGSVTGGTGTFLPSQGVGFSSFVMSIGNLDYDHAVYTPNTIGGGNGIFSLEINPTGVTSTVTGVLGQAVQQNDTLLQADGSLNLVTVPLPPAGWALGGALVALAAWGRRRPTSPRPARG